jgi:hypothetical protein
MDMKHGQAAWTMDMQHGHEVWICAIDLQYGKAATGMQHGHAPSECSTEKHNVQAAST